MKKEKRIVNNGIEKLNIEAEGEKQKRLKEHQDDIVKCAEMFFLQYGAYFTEKEKNLVIEACRIHDLGKANLLFQMVVQPKLKMIFKDDKNESQIPHGFLSAISISEEEFLKWSELFEKEDFRHLLQRYIIIMIARIIMKAEKSENIVKNITNLI